MSELVVLAFDDPFEADRALIETSRLQTEYLVDLEDAVVAVRRPDGTQTGTYSVFKRDKAI